MHVYVINDWNDLVKKRVTQEFPNLLGKFCFPLRFNLAPEAFAKPAAATQAFISLSLSFQIGYMSLYSDPSFDKHCWDKIHHYITVFELNQTLENGQHSYRSMFTKECRRRMKYWLSWAGKTERKPSKFKDQVLTQLYQALMVLKNITTDLFNNTVVGTWKLMSMLLSRHNH